MFNPFDQKPIPIEKTLIDWNKLYAKPYNKMEVDPWTKRRIILMNGIEVEAVMFGHNFHRNCKDQELRRQIAAARRGEQQQQKTVNWLSPGDESQLETTIGYEHVAVDLTAWLAQNEPDKYVKQCLDFALLEDFDHLYRFANLLMMDEGIPSHKMVKDYVEIMPGRPTISEHRHPFEHVKTPVDFKKADIRTILSTLIITSGEQQTMNFYMNMGPTYENDPGRKLYQEIAMVEEEHVTHYGSLLDPNSTWLENMLLREYMECYLYYSFYTDEPHHDIKKIWEMHLEQEISHLHAVKDLLQKHEKKDWKEVLPQGEFPELLHFHDTKDYVRKILEEQILLTADKETFKSVEEIPDNHEFFEFQHVVNKQVATVPSHVVINNYISEHDEDYRSEIHPHPIKELRKRNEDNTTIGRKKK